MPVDSGQLVDWGAFARARGELGGAFVRILGYFREDGAKAVTAVEEAMRDRSSARLVLPAHTLKGESRQFGATPLSELAERIEMGARRCVEAREEPDELFAHVVELRPLFDATLRLFDQEMRAAAPAPRPAAGGFGRRASPAGFGTAQR